MKRITKIEAAKDSKRKLRVAAYARVSTDSDEQLVSLETQKNHYERYIKAKPDWEYAGLYYDEGVTGTKMAKRDGLLRLLADCDRGLIDYIIVKSISRFSRNTVDSIETVRQLCEKGIYIYFEKENIDTGKRIYSSRYALSSLVFCGHCGDIFRRVKWNNRGCKSTVWRCVSRVLKKSSGIDCPARTIHEEDLQAAVVTAINDAWARKDTVIPLLQENIRKVLENDTEERLAKVDAAIKEKQAELLDAGKDQKRIDEIGDAIISLREERQDILTEAAKNTELKERVDDLAAFLGEQTEALSEYSETLVRRLIEKITVYDEKLTVEFKSGLEIDVEA